MIWKTIRGFDQYEISNTGIVRSLYHRHGKRTTPLILKPFLSNKGYFVVSLCSNGTSKNQKIHILVLETFGVLRPSSKHVVDHINRDRTDNRIENLRWVTDTENVLKNSSGIAALNLRKTHCKYGHEFTPENTIIQKKNKPGKFQRACRICTLALRIKHNRSAATKPLEPK